MGADRCGGLTLRTGKSFNVIVIKYEVRREEKRERIDTSEIRFGYLYAFLCSTGYQLIKLLLYCIALFDFFIILFLLEFSGFNIDFLRSE